MSATRDQLKVSPFILDIPSLKPGDIILTRDKTLTSTGIQAFTACKYSHASIYVGNTIIEATIKGVFSKNPQRLLFDKPNDAAVFRSRSELSESQILDICQYARSKTGSLYALDEAITIRFRSTIGLIPSNRQFCSRLVAESYKSAGFDLKNLRNPAYCTPRQLSLCKAFYKVQGVVRQASPAEVAFANSYDPVSKNQEQTYQWLDNARTLVKSKEIEIQTINDINCLLLIHPNFDKEIANFMKQSGYLEFYNYDRGQNPYRYSDKLFICTMLQHSDHYQFLMQELNKEENMFKIYKNNLDGYISHIKAINLECFQLHLELYINLIEEVNARLEVIKNSAQHILDIEMADKIAGTQNTVMSIISEARTYLR